MVAEMGARSHHRGYQGHIFRLSIVRLFADLVFTLIILLRPVGSGSSSTAITKIIIIIITIIIFYALLARNKPGGLSLAPSLISIRFRKLANLGQ